MTKWTLIILKIFRGLRKYQLIINEVHMKIKNKKL